MAAKKKITAPKRMPRPSVEDTGAPEVSPKEDHQTALDAYMRLNGISNAAFSRSLGIEHKTTLELRNGDSMPTLPVAYEIERITKRAVPMVSWLALPKAQESLKRMRAKQPEDLRNVKPEDVS